MFPSLQVVVINSAGYPVHLRLSEVAAAIAHADAEDLSAVSLMVHIAEVCPLGNNVSPNPLAEGIARADAYGQPFLFQESSGKRETMAPEAVGAALERDVARVGWNPCGERDVGRQSSGEVEILTCHPAVVAQSAGRVFGVKIGYTAVYRAVQLREDVPAQVIVECRALRVPYVLEGGIHGTGRGEVLPVVEILPAAAHDVADALDAVVEEGV